MGFTPLEGLMMGTRSGNFDVGAMLYIMRTESKPEDSITDILNRSDDLLNKKSGMLGISGFSDMRDAQLEAEAGNEKCELALDMYAYRVKKYIGSYTAAMGGVDIIVFSGGIGENNTIIRQKICSDLEFMGVFMNFDINSKIKGELQEISAHYSKVKVIIVPTNEELVIARETLELVLSKNYNISHE